jgi:ABC-type lipoprotein release transport system permease subunit
VILLVCLTAGLVLFTRAFRDSLAYGHEEMAYDLADAALQLNMLTLVLLSVIVFFLAYFFSAQGRVGEFGVLRALGVSAGQLLALLALEGLVVLLLGLLAGAILGFGLAYIMIPYLSPVLAESLAGAVIERMVVDWFALARLYVLLLVAYGSALALVVLVLIRAQIRFLGNCRGDPHTS